MLASLAPAVCAILLTDVNTRQFLTGLRLSAELRARAVAHSHSRHVLKRRAPPAGKAQRGGRPIALVIVAVVIGHPDRPLSPNAHGERPGGLEGDGEASCQVQPKRPWWTRAAAMAAAMIAALS